MATASRAENRVRSNKIELQGVLAGSPEIRTTPGGKALVRMLVECGERGLRLDVVMVGDDVRERVAALRSGQGLTVSGTLIRRQNSGGAQMGVEVLANEIKPAPES